MRPWKIVLPSAIAAICAAAAMLRPGLAAAPDGFTAVLLPRLPALALTVIAVYALIAIVSTAGGLIAAALDLSRHLGRTDAVSQAAAALDWIAALDATPLRTLVPRPVGALPKSAKHNTTILLDARFDPREARDEAAHLYYLWLARTHCLGALVGLAAIVALGFAQGQGEAAFLAGGIPAGPAALVLVGLLLLVLLGRFAIDVTIAPLIDAASRLPWEQVDAGRLRYAVDLLETTRIDAVTSGRSVAGIPSELPERLAGVFEDSGRSLAAAGVRLSLAAETLGAMTSSAITEVAAAVREIGETGSDRGEQRIAALLTSIEALTARLDPDKTVPPLARHLERDRQTLVDAMDRLSVATEAQGAATRAAIEGLEAALRESMLATAGDGYFDGIAAAPIAALQTSIEALTARLDRNPAVSPPGDALAADRRALADAIERLSAATEAQGAPTRAAIEGLEAALRESMISPAEDREPADDRRFAGLQASLEALTARLDRNATPAPADQLAADQRALTDAIEHLSAATEAQGVTTRAAIEGLTAALRESMLSPAADREPADDGRLAMQQASLDALTAELEELTALTGAAGETSSAVAGARP